MKARLLTTVPSPEGDDVRTRAWPRWPAGWAAVARAADVRAGSSCTVDFAGQEVALFRTRDGTLHAVDAYCPHMGAHLGRARVDDDGLQCALHHRTVKDAGCFRAEERFGLVFLTRGDFRGALPDVAHREGLVFSAAAPVSVKVPWANFVLNGFDVPHLEAVHRRRLRAPVRIERHADSVSLDYETAITGVGLSDLVMKVLSRNHVKARMSCFATVGVVEADLGWTRSVLVCGVTPKLATTDASKPWPTGESEAFVSVGAPRDALAPRLRTLLSRWLYLAFLGRDFAVLEKQRLSLANVDDESTLAVADFLTSREDWAR